MAGENMQSAKRLQAGETLKFRPRGKSMSGRIEDGQLVTVEPIPLEYTLEVNDVVLVKVNGRVCLHLISAIGSDGRYQISNNHNYVNGWATRENVFGICTNVEN